MQSDIVFLAPTSCGGLSISCRKAKTRLRIRGKAAADNLARQSHAQIMETTMANPTDIKPPFTEETALAKVRSAEDAWNSRDPQRVSLAYSRDSEWRNRDLFLQGREAIRSFLSEKWEKELDYRLTKSLWTYSDQRIAVRFQYEYHDASAQWYRAYGNELWEFDEAGLMRRREASINDLAILQSERKFHWDAPGPRPQNDLGILSIL